MSQEITGVPEISTINTANLVSNIFGFMVKFAIIGGALWTVWGVVYLASSLKDKNGPNLQMAIWQIVGGIMILVSAVIFKQLVIIQ